MSEQRLRIQIAREGEMPTFEGWYEPVTLGRRRFSQDEVDELRYHDAHQIKHLTANLATAEERIHQLEAAIEKLYEIVVPF